ncbi:hypothetical protein [Tenacibaculum maritimum]|uniref:hypothetical protein n=1 Tax=Tenacibaculum maritimum TaxID=107401 RepID=UPI0038904865
MKNVKFALLLGLSSVLTIGCSSSASEDFEEINQGVSKKIIKSISTVSNLDFLGNNSVVLVYDADKKLKDINAVRGVESTSLSYSNTGSSIEISGDESEVFNVEKLYKSPYDALERGEVIEYDANKNPYKIAFNEEEYDDSNNEVVIKKYVAELTYDDAPNPYFYTLEAAGIIAILDRVELDFTVNPQATEIIKARALFPVNNLSRIVYKNEENEVKHSITIDYEYDKDNYPVKGVATSVGTSGDTDTISVTYEYE